MMKNIEKENEFMYENIWIPSFVCAKDARNQEYRNSDDNSKDSSFVSD